MEQRVPGNWFYEMQELGFNYRITDFQCALASSQLRKLDGWISRRQEIAVLYRKLLDEVGEAVLPAEPPGREHVYHLYVIRTSRRAELAAFLKARSIQTGIHYPVPTHRQPAVERYAPPALPATERLVDEILTLPLSAGHSDAEIDEVAAAVRAFFEG